MHEQLPVVLVHGFGGGGQDYGKFKELLSGRGYAIDLHEFYYAKRFGQISLAEVADELARYIESNVSQDKFNVIGFSQGGLIFRSFAMRYPKLASRVNAIVTICTPHHGSLLAYFWFGKGTVDLRPGSRFLRNLAEHNDKITYYAVYNPFDLIVIPGTSARFERAVVNRRVFAPSHFLTFGSRKTNEFIESILFPVKTK